MLVPAALTAAHVLLTYETYEQFIGGRGLLDRLGEPAGVEDIELTIPTLDDEPRPAGFE